MSPTSRRPSFPLVALVVSGGHTFLVEMADHLTYRLLGQTVDDAAGEAFDKVGRLLGLPYPGGPAIMKAAAGAQQRDRVFPRAWLGESFDFSFSGLKTAARREVARELGTEVNAMAPMPSRCPRRRSPSWHTASRNPSSTCCRARRCARPRRVGARTIIVGGGVAANTRPARDESTTAPRAARHSRSSCRGLGCAPTTRR